MTAEYRLRGVLADLDTVYGAISDLAQRHALPEDVTHPLRLALDELITNVVEHGFHARALDQRQLVLRLAASGDAVEATIEDNGIPFDPTSAAGADPAGELDDRPIGGLGLHLVRRSIDTMHYRRDGDRNLLTIIKLRRPLHDGP
jgi:anti-sigma regulatory factor (Ser/Thr protein kinase)